MADTIPITTPAGDMTALVAAPAGPAKGGVVVVQEAFGLTDHIASICDRLAAAGWRAVAPALYHRQGSPTFTLAEFDALRSLMGELTAEGIRSDVDGALGHLAGLGVTDDRTAIVGFCMGGAVALEAATRQALGAAVTFYGGGVAEGRFGFPSLIDLAPSLRTPWLGLYADLDKGIPPAQVEDLRAAAAKAPVTTEVVRYAEADHGFNNDDRPDVFEPTAAEDAWRRTLSWFDLYAGPDPAGGPD
jgi:carboxymethylenebutenolidase